MTAALISFLLPRWRGLAFALAALALVWLGWHAHAVVTQARQAAELREQIKARKVAEERAAAVSRQAEAELAALRQTNTELTRRAAHETTKPDYRTRLPDAGRVLYNAACCGSDPGQPDPAVPEPATPR